MFPDSVPVSAHLGKWSCLPDFTSSLQQSVQTTARIQVSWQCLQAVLLGLVLGEAAAHALKSGWMLLAGLCSEARLRAPHSSRAGRRAP